MKKTLYSNTVKIVLSATISIIIATKLGLEFSVTAGIISILSIQSTRVESILVAIKRFIAVSIAILLSYFLYLLLGTNPIVFGLFLLIFVPFFDIVPDLHGEALKHPRAIIGFNYCE